jgi:hypothetical protein
MNLGISFYTDIKEFLSIPGDNKELEKVLGDSSFSEEEQVQILKKILKFIKYFTIFKDIKPFMGAVYICIKKTFEVKVNSVNDVDKLFVKNALQRFMTEFVNYSKMNKNDHILNYLAGSLQRLQVQPLILNLGFLLKPMYNDKEYLKKIKGLDDEEVTYVINSENEIKIKKRMDFWINAQELSLDRQDELKESLINEFDGINMTDRRNISRESEEYKRLIGEIVEMLSLKLTVLSLMESIPEESFLPEPIK